MHTTWVVLKNTFINGTLSRYVSPCVSLIGIHGLCLWHWGSACHLIGEWIQFEFIFQRGLFFSEDAYLYLECIVSHLLKAVYGLECVFYICFQSVGKRCACSCTCRCVFISCIQVSSQLSFYTTASRMYVLLQWVGGCMQTHKEHKGMQMVCPTVQSDDGSILHSPLYKQVVY